MSKKKVIGLVVIGLVVISILANSNKSNENSDKVIINNEVTDITPIKEVEDAQTEIQNIPTVINEAQEEQHTQVEVDNNESIEYNGNSYKIIEVDGGDLSSNRLSNVAVDIGYGDRVYWAFSNEYGQLIYVLAEEIILQDDENEPVKSNGRYYSDEAKVPGTEQEDLDEGHIIADSLGGVSNAYNINPQNSTLNRHGDQAYMEKVIRDSGGCTDFVATITYPDNVTQIPSHYYYEYVLNGEKIIDEFDNVNPDEVNANLDNQVNEDTNENASGNINDAFNEKDKLATIDTNGNGKVTISEAKAAGCSMPIYSDHWLYKYMDDRDDDGEVGE